MATNQDAINIATKKQFDQLVALLREMAKEIERLDGRVRDVEKSAGGSKDYSKDITALGKRIDALEKKK
jgi:predicted RNase H-like nuclease (RuvC/YqgF family)